MLTWDLWVTLSKQSKKVSLLTGSTGLSRMLLTAYKEKKGLTISVPRVLKYNEAQTPKCGVEKY